MQTAAAVAAAAAVATVATVATVAVKKNSWYWSLPVGVSVNKMFSNKKTNSWYWSLGDP